MERKYELVRDDKTADLKELEMNEMDYFSIKGVLEGAANGTPPFRFDGLCNNIVNSTLAMSYEDLYPFYEECFTSWPEFSGCEVYPVSDPENKGSSKHAEEKYVSCMTDGSLYDDTEYGFARRRLASHMLTCLIEIYGNNWE